MIGNGVVGILSESTSKWERRVPLAPSHCAQFLHSEEGETGVITRIIVQSSQKRIHHDALYEDAGCEISDDLSECGLILGIKPPKMEMILPDRAYAFFSHTHKAQKENMPLLDKILAERASLFDYELIVGEDKKRLLAFGEFAGRAGVIDFLHGLGQSYLNRGFSTPFLSLGASYMYASLDAAKAAVKSVGDEIKKFGLPSEICPLVFIFTGSSSGNVSQGAQEIFRLLPHEYVNPGTLPELFGTAEDSHSARYSKRVFQVYGSVVTCHDMVEPKDPTKPFDKVDYYAHPEHYSPVFHEKIAPYASVIVNCMYWERRFPRLLTTKQMEELMRKGCPLVGISDITCDIGGSIEFVNQSTSIDSPFFRYDPFNDSYHQDIDGHGLICSAVDILPTEFAKEASQHFGDILSQFIGNLASIKDIEALPVHLRKACITHGGALTSLYEYIPRLRNSNSEDISKHIGNCNSSMKKKYNRLVSLTGHLFDQFLINKALDIIEAAGGSFHLIKCQLGQSTKAVSYSELEIGADDSAVLDKIIDSLSSIANPSENHGLLNGETNMISFKLGKIHNGDLEKEDAAKKKTVVLVLGAGRVCRPAVEFLASIGSSTSRLQLETCIPDDFQEKNDVQVIVASLYLRDAEEITEGIANATAVQLDIKDHESLSKYISQVEIVISLLPPRFHGIIANACIQIAPIDYVFFDSLSSIANPSENHGLLNEETNMISFKLATIHNGDLEKEDAAKKKTVVLVLGAGRVCRPAVEFLASIGSSTSRLQLETCIPDDFQEKNDVQVIVASLYLRDAEEITEGIANATAVQLDILDHESLCKYISQVEIVISLLPPRCHGIIANACIQLRKHLVTASYVDDSVSQLDGEAKSAGITILGEMGLDPGIDHMMAMKIVNEAHEKRGRIKSFTSYCGGLPSPAAANNPLAYKFSWNPAGAILAGRNSATYRSHGERVHVDGNDLYRAAMKFRIPDLPAFALECLPNRDSLTYGDIYGIGYEASTIFRGTLRYEGFSEIMETLARIGFFDTKPHPTLDFENRPTYVSFLLELLKTPNGNLAGKVMGENDVMETILGLGLCQDQEIATKTAKTIVFLGLHEEIEVPVSCKSAFDVICLRMEERLAYSNTEQDMVLLHHEVEVEFPDGQPAKKHKATLLEFGRTENGKTTTAMASTVGIPAAIGALLLLADKIKTRGVLRPIEPEVYVPALEILQAYGIKLLEKMD